MNGKYVMKMILITAIALFLANAAQAQTPSFDCNKAATDDEFAICSDDYLSNLDVLYANAYAAIKRDQGATVAKAFAAKVMARRRACGWDIGCIANVLENALNGLENQADSETGTMNDLIDAWNQANGICRGSNDAAKIDRYCHLRDQLDQDLQRIGLCAGNYLFDYPDFEMATILREKWIPCIYKDLQ